MNVLNREDIKFLKELAHELKTQDNRCTASPYYYSVRQQKRIYGMDDEYSDDYLILYYDGDAIEYETDEDIQELKERLIEEFSCEENKKYEFVIDDIKNISDLSDMRDFIENYKWRADDDMLEYYSVLGYKEQDVYENAFLTEKAVRQHLKCNGHNYNKTQDNYLHHAYRNPELERLLEIIKKFDEVI